jgi:serine-type D-Ala-D-Ala carboxypeptidase/endopeptidase
LKERAAGPSPANPIGLAWILAPLNGRRVALHDGGTFGFASTVILDPERRRAAVLLSNAAGSVNDLAIHAVDPSVPPRDVAAEKRQTAREPVVVDAAALAPLAGVYALNPNFKLFLRVQDGKLLVRATGQGEFELFGIDPRRFFARVTPLEMEFEGSAGVPAALELRQGGQKLRFVRE